MRQTPQLVGQFGNGLTFTLKIDPYNMNRCRRFKCPLGLHETKKGTRKPHAWQGH